MRNSLIIENKHKYSRRKVHLSTAYLQTVQKTKQSMYIYRNGMTSKWGKMLMFGASRWGIYVNSSCYFFKFSPEDVFLLIFREGKGERERGRETCISWLLYMSWPAIVPETFWLWDDIPTNGATQPGLCYSCSFTLSL